jgi:hypothetical protein
MMAGLEEARSRHETAPDSVFGPDMVTADNSVIGSSLLFHFFPHHTATKDTRNTSDTTLYTHGVAIIYDNRAYDSATPDA